MSETRWQRHLTQNQRKREKYRRDKAKPPAAPLSPETLAEIERLRISKLELKAALLAARMRKP